MLVECLIEREGPTYVDLGKARYVFGPVPVLTGGDCHSSVCEINQKEHWEHLLQMPQLYREYKPKSRAQIKVMELKKIHNPDLLTEAVNECQDLEALKDFINLEIVALNSRDWLVGLLTERITELEPKQAQPAKVREFKLTKETFRATTNVMAVKSLIKKCNDPVVLQELLDEEDAAPEPREWVGEALAARLKELE